MSDELGFDMSDELMSCDLHVYDDVTARTLLKFLKCDKGLTNLSLEFGSWQSRMGEQRAHLYDCIYEALKVKPDIHELTIISMNDLGLMDEILVANKSIAKLITHDHGCLPGTPPPKFEAIRSLLTRGPPVEIHFESYGNFDAVSFGNAIPTNSTLVSLTLANCKLREKGMDTIFKAVQRCSALSFLDLSGNSLNGDDACAIGEMLRVNSTITELVLNSNELGHSPIFDALRTNSVLEKLHLVDNDDKDRLTGQHIVQALQENSTLTELYLVGTQISQLEIIHALRQNTGLKTLAIQNSDIDDPQFEAKSFGEAIEHNSTLTELVLSHFLFNLTTAFALALGGNQTLRVLDLSTSCITFETVEAFGDVLKSNTSIIVLKLLLAEELQNSQPCPVFCEGLKANETLQTLWFSEDCDIVEGDPEDRGATAIAKALIINTSLESVTLVQRYLSTECLELLAFGLEHSTTIENLVLQHYNLEEDQAFIFAEGLALNESLKSLDFGCHDPEGAEYVADALKRNTSLEEIKIRLIDEDDLSQIIVFAQALEVNTSLQEMYLPEAMLCDGDVGKEALMEAYRDNPSLKCEIFTYETGMCESSSWHYYWLNVTGRLLWPMSTFPATLWPRALALADMRSSSECPDLLFHFIMQRPDMFKDPCREGLRKKPKLSYSVD